MPTANRARVSPARAALPARAGAMLSVWGLRRCCVTPLDELPPPCVWCGKSFGTTTVEPDVVLAAWVAATNDHLPSTCAEDFNGFAFDAIARGLGVHLPLKGTDFSSLLRSELELKLQPVGVTETANDECPFERVEAVFADLVDSGSAINVDGNDAAIFWTSA